MTIKEPLVFADEFGFVQVSSNRLSLEEATRLFGELPEVITAAREAGRMADEKVLRGLEERIAILRQRLGKAP